MTEQETWEETPDDVIMAGSNQVMSHQERYEFVKNRVYYPVKPSKMVVYDKDADAIYIYLKDSKAVESRASESISYSAIVDYDQNGDVVGVEILSFLSKLSQSKPIKREDIGIWLRSLLD
jgi:uncharacterized protein YuzE